MMPDRTQSPTNLTKRPSPQHCSGELQMDTCELTQYVVTEEGAAVLNELEQLALFKHEMEELFRQRIQAFLNEIEEQIQIAVDQLPTAFSSVLEPLEVKILEIQELLTHNENQSVKIRKVRRKQKLFRRPIDYMIPQSLELLGESEV